MAYANNINISAVSVSSQVCGHCCRHTVNERTHAPLTKEQVKRRKRRKASKSQTNAKNTAKVGPAKTISLTGAMCTICHHCGFKTIRGGALKKPQKMKVAREQKDSKKEDES
eukprot:CAMPEP_0117440190 /NCGR_PEP_ID=MMETSP0759-20121206/2956_1 /TAXON_ID=63605 /ORGANISM="Percolomonas cosmopolitus, Strain WS" /LENGTH=111 /DNA_ID=CAMNT_0005231935 /DNA_START=93 /DNA_END=428 /DNA_ORIENTATION=+